jgi:hypothetical protein
MLDNKHKFDVITPLTDFHRMSRVLKDDGEYMDVVTYPGMWVKNITGGVVGTRSGAGKGFTMLCLNNYDKDNVYEAHDTAVGYITCVAAPGVTCVAGQFYITTSIATLNVGDQLAVISTSPMPDVEIGKLVKAAATSDVVNAVVTGLDEDNGLVEYMIVSPYNFA